MKFTEIDRVSYFCAMIKNLFQVLGLVILLISCQNNPEKEIREQGKDHATYLYEKSKETENIEEKLTGVNFKDDLHNMLSQSVPKDVKLYLVGYDSISWLEISSESKIVLHRILQELMVNMKKHSNASMVSLNFQEQSSILQVNYNDNGRGFSSTELKNGNGLKNVENRIVSIGGSFNFPIEKSTGISIQLLIPF
ncbi:sensor histidine kinase [Salinimicrobium sp. GXAS 041]|uniref:sensor histidine kinase n=1 Tax=Salinimicrobium sp. GXAS 041 TaxID=3400806 RepID=UPI003C761BB2